MTLNDSPNMNHKIQRLLTTSSIVSMQCDQTTYKTNFNSPSCLRPKTPSLTKHHPVSNISNSDGQCYTKKHGRTPKLQLHSILFTKFLHAELSTPSNDQTHHF